MVSTPYLMAGIVNNEFPHSLLPDQRDLQRFRITTETERTLLLRHEFPAEGINLNPGTLATVPASVHHAMQLYRNHHLCAFPLSHYQAGRHLRDEIRRLIRRIFNVPVGHRISLGGGTSALAELLATHLATSLLRAGHSGPIRMLATDAEHKGGLGAFTGHRDYEVRQLTQEERRNPARFTEICAEFQPDAAFFSTVTWITGEEPPLREWYACLKQKRPRCLIIQDAAQAAGLLPLDFNAADITLASGHKWLHGPHGCGFFIGHQDAVNRLDPRPGSAGEGPPWGENQGGRDFATDAGFLMALAIQETAGTEDILQRSLALRDYFLGHLFRLSPAAATLWQGQAGLGPGCVFLPFGKQDPWPVYDQLNRRGIYGKCIKEPGFSGMRFGFPWFETFARMDDAARHVAAALAGAGIKAKGVA